MKTAISIPESLFAAAERASKRLGVSRSRLYQLALSEFLKSNRNTTIREALDEVYRTDTSSLDPVLEQMQLASVAAEEW